MLKEARIQRGANARIRAFEYYLLWTNRGEHNCIAVFRISECFVMPIFQYSCRLLCVLQDNSLLRVCVQRGDIAFEGTTRPTRLSSVHIFRYLALSLTGPTSVLLLYTVWLCGSKMSWHFGLCHYHPSLCGAVKEHHWKWRKGRAKLVSRRKQIRKRKSHMSKITTKVRPYHKCYLCMINIELQCTWRAAGPHH